MAAKRTLLTGVSGPRLPRTSEKTWLEHTSILGISELFSWEHESRDCGRFRRGILPALIGQYQHSPGHEHNSQEPDSCLPTNMDFPCRSSLGLRSQSDSSGSRLRSEFCKCIVIALETASCDNGWLGRGRHQKPLNATFHRVALQTVMSSLAYLRRTPYSRENRSATCHVDIKLGQRYCIWDTRPGLDAVNMPLIRHTCTNSPRSRRGVRSAGVDAHWLAWAPLCLLCGTLSCSATGGDYPNWEIPSGSSSVPQREYPQVSISRGAGVGGINCWTTLSIIKVSRVADAGPAQQRVPETGSENTGRGRCARCFRSPGHSNLQQLPAPWRMIGWTTSAKRQPCSSDFLTSDLHIFDDHMQTGSLA